VTGDRQEQVLQEWAAARRPDSDPELEAVRTAILLEDALGVALTDDQIDPGVLGDPARVRALLAGHGEVC
jgi:hypothetical protein